MTMKQSKKLTMNTGSAITRDMYYMSCSFAGSSLDEPYSRLFFYQDKNKDKWFYHDQQNWHVVSTCFPPPITGEVRKVYALSEEGDIECFSREATITEKIKDAGLEPSSKFYGYVNKINHIDGNLYVCGHRGQIYKKNKLTWEHFDDGILQTEKLIPDDADLSFREKIRNSVNSTLDLFDINGSRNNIYTVGNNGFIAHHNGINWLTLAKLTAADLHCAHLTQTDVVWIVGSQGTVLNGSADLGFKVLTRKMLDSDFYSITEFQGRMFIGASDGIYTFHNSILSKLNIAVKEVSSIESKDGVLWVLSSEKLLRFDGQTWEEFKHIDN
ncbi:hypothetical protein [Pseudomonas fluorescens]|uniref:Uncharacterized protein n=1 Tax=Pseudomonas fluorescens TaxID=294 RepID=A0A5E7BM17_PSEFL|nr:hypothetical protein [Pseudomonas fluorescens]VVN92655.1 hypothetical protein PS723_01999 [Pseudomonas fluorescens]